MSYGMDFTPALILFFILGICAVIGCYFLIDWLFISDDFVSKVRLIPEIRETCINGICDTVYIYKNIR